MIPREYLEPLRRTERLNRDATALLLDTAARACVDARSVGTRLAVITAHRIKSQRAYQRLGYRTVGDYVREELGITARAFRDLARLGLRLELLPATKRAFLAGEITRTQAEAIAGIATEADEGEWLARAKTGTVRELKAAVRKAREKHARMEAGESESSEREVTTGEKASRADTADGADAADAESEPRRRYSFDLPTEMLGKIDAVLELTARVAGAAMPPGTLWEFIAAEYLSGVPAGAPEPEGHGSPDSTGTSPAAGRPRDATGSSAETGWPRDAAGTIPAAARPRHTTGTRPAGDRIMEGSADPRRPRDDPRSFQEILERESRRWRYLPSARPSLELHGDWKQLRDRCGEDGPRSAWDLHRDMTAALAAERCVDWQLGRLLGTIRNRRLWHSMLFASFSHYVGERLGISVRAAERLIRIDREGWKYPALRRACEAGELSPLVAETLVRVLPHVERHPETQQAWVDYAQKSTFERFCKVVRVAELLRAQQAPRDRALLGLPCAVERALDEAESEPPMFVTCRTPGNEATSPMLVGSRAPERDEGGVEATPPMFVTARYAVWMDDDEHQVLGRAIVAVRGVLGGGETAIGGGAIGDESGSGREIPIWVCLAALLDHFVSEYDGVQGRRMRAEHPLLERDGWQCRVPGCRAYGPLQLHHIVFRSHGGSDEPENLVTLCDFHHKALHDGWIRCGGRAPDALYWKLGVDRTEGPAEAPVARIAGDQRLTAGEYWDGVAVRPVAAKQASGSAEGRAA